MPYDLDAVYRKAIVRAMTAFEKDKDGAAEALGIGRGTLYRMIDTYGIHPSEYGADAAACQRYDDKLQRRLDAVERSMLGIPTGTPTARKPAKTKPLLQAEGDEIELD